MGTYEKEFPMNAQTLTFPMTLCNFVLAPDAPIFADPRDYGFDFDEDELERELLAPLPRFVQSIPEVDESNYAPLYFLA
ncbi:MAG: hypothetical protein DYG85_03785 [Chloroflexi bacterium CFX1]|nr:hypothetical protein [Chloroflexi bacterium CFX1]MCQ3952153.1 hypothetical protein [Chloroflexota bacterium]